MDSPPTGMLTAGPPDLGPPRRRRTRPWAVVIALLVIVLIAAGKPVFHAEYDLPTTAYCQQTTALGISSIRKELDLSAWRETC